MMTTRKSSSSRKTRLKNKHLNEKNSDNQEKSEVSTSSPPPATSSPAAAAKPSPSNVAGNTINNVCSTPKADKYRIPEIGTCPPAPKKRRIVKSSCTLIRRRSNPTPFFAPPDIELFFYFALRGIIPV